MWCGSTKTKRTCVERTGRHPVTYRTPTSFFRSFVAFLPRLQLRVFKSGKFAWRSHSSWWSWKALFQNQGTMAKSFNCWENQNFWHDTSGLSTVRLLKHTSNKEEEVENMWKHLQRQLRDYDFRSAFDIIHRSLAISDRMLLQRGCFPPLGIS